MDGGLLGGKGGEGVGGGEWREGGESTWRGKPEGCTLPLSQHEGLARRDEAVAAVRVQGGPATERCEGAQRLQQSSRVRASVKARASERVGTRFRAREGERESEGQCGIRVRVEGEDGGE